MMVEAGGLEPPSRGLKDRTLSLLSYASETGAPTRDRTWVSRCKGPDSEPVELSRQFGTPARI